ncbi:unnamed protein product [Adineta steineri]|uniref:Uncharacterized protein n=1 Tax=Adineta steineri TaxID=433720 RepID=A0A820BE33_9BILA|nr:unnamed protein product [Adineta steineri]
MPHLRIFNFQRHYKIPFKYPETYSTRGLFSSIKPYRRKDLHLNYINNQCKSSRLIENNFDSIRHIFIGNRYKSLLSTIVSTESISIPDVIQLTFDEDGPIHDDFIQNLSNSSIHLSQITKMTFNKRTMSCDIIIKILQVKN